MYTLRTVCLQSRVNVLQILARTLANVQSYRTIMSAPVILVFTERAAKVNDLALINMTCPRAVVSLRGSCRNHALPRSPRENPQLVAILSLDVHNMLLKNLQLDNITWLALPRTSTASPRKLKPHSAVHFVCLFVHQCCCCCCRVKMFCKDFTFNRYSMICFVS